MQGLITKEILQELYFKKGQSMAQIAKKLRCSVHKVSYWMTAYNLKTRSIAEAIYQWHNPDGDPFVFRKPRTLEEERLFGLGLGLYWGEGTKANKTSIRLGNTDPFLIKVFMIFLVKFFAVKKNEMRFGLQIFTDIEPARALDFWAKTLKIKKHQFLNPVVTKSVSRGTYKKKAPYGVVTIYYHNRKMRDLLMQQLADVAQLVEQLHGGSLRRLRRPRILPISTVTSRMNPE